MRLMWEGHAIHGQTPRKARRVRPTLRGRVQLHKIFSDHTKSVSLGSIAVTLGQQAKPLDRMAGLVYPMSLFGISILAASFNNGCSKYVPENRGLDLNNEL